MCSTPPTRTTSAAPIAISPAPLVVAVSAPAHMRSTANPGTDFGKSCQQRDVAAERQSLIADLRGRGEHDIVDLLFGEARIAAQQLAHDLDGHVVGACPPEVAVLARATESGADTVDVDHLPKRASHRRRRYFAR